MEKVLETKNICKTYNKHLVLDNVSVCINKGDIYGLIGKNGSGKTTLIRVVSGLINYEGEYYLWDVSSKSPEIYKQKRRMAAIVETPSIALDLNAFDNLKQQCIMLGIDDNQRIIDLLKTVGLAEVDTSKKSKNYSLGMKQRLGIAMALISNPDLIMLDEPMNGLDPQGIVHLRELILKLNTERGITFIISSHILDELAKVATRYGFVNRGKLLEEISAAELALKANKCIKLKLNVTAGVSDALENKLNIQTYKILSDNDLEIYQETDLSMLITTLAEAGFIVTDICTHNENIEEYYLNLVGGIN